MSSNDARAGLPRRFTTNALPTMSPMAQQRRQAAAGESTLVSISMPLHVRNATLVVGNGNGQCWDDLGGVSSMGIFANVRRLLAGSAG